MHGSIFALLKQRRFLPLFASQTLGALNDNLFKNALLILMTYEMAQGNPILVTLGGGIFILPFLLFSALGGELADRLEKAHWIRRLKQLEIGIMLLAGSGFLLNSLMLLFIALFLMGAQSALMSPIKFALLPQHQPRERLVGANGLLEAGMFLATLAGTIAGTLLIPLTGGPEITTTVLLGLALVGYGTSRFIPSAAIGDPELQLDLRPWTAIARVMGTARAYREVFLAMLGIGWFYLLGATFLAQFPNFAKTIFNANHQVVTLFLTTFSVGIAIGSLACHRLLRGEISLRFLPWAAFAMAVFAVDLFFASRALGPVAPTALAGLLEFLAHPGAWRVLLDLTGLAVAGGLYVVPLYAFIQAHTPEAERSRIFGAVNVINAGLAVFATLITMALYGLGLDTAQVFLVAALGHLLVLAYIIRLLPRTTLKGLIAMLFKTLFRAEVRGLANYPPLQQPAVIVANHQSFLDAPLLASLLPGKPVFAIGANIARAFWVRPWLHLVEALPMLPTNPFAIKRLTQKAREGKHCIIFPEGRITETGALMKIYEGPGVIADHADAPIVPIRIEGAQFSLFSLLGGKLRRRLFPKITLTILPPRRLMIPAHVKGSERRELAGEQLSELMAEMMYAAEDRDLTLFQALRQGAQHHGARLPIIEDTDRGPLSYRQLSLACLVLGKQLARTTRPREMVGVMLPNSVGACIGFLALSAYGRVPAMLNFTQGTRDWQAACQAAQLRQVITSRRFIERAELGAALEQLRPLVDIVYLEDVAAGIGLRQRLAGLMRLLGLTFGWKVDRSTPEQPAVVLFTSGSEGAPKGVVLSHRNIIANIHQVRARLDFNLQDRLLSAMPMFHSFGLMAGVLLPLVAGVRTFFYPTPLHYRIIPELVYRHNSTILFATDSFLAGYARRAHAYDFYRLRLVVAGAEPLREPTRQIWIERFGIRIHEGYGVTETSPVLALNTPIAHCAGTVGRLVPGLEHRVEPIEGIARGGRLVVRGENVMLGYLRPSQPGHIEPPAAGWYDTGDLVEIDAQGFVHILGRVKRFAKVAGEMVSLAGVEQLAAKAYPDLNHAAVALPDSRRGEQIILVSAPQAALRERLTETAQQLGLSELTLPRRCLTLPDLPLLGTGKIDYRRINEWLTSEEQQAAATASDL